MHITFHRFLPLALGGMLTLGFGFGFGLASSGKPFMLEAYGTPIGSFTLKGNLFYIETLPAAPIKEQGQRDWADYIA